MVSYDLQQDVAGNGWEALGAEDRPCHLKGVWGSTALHVSPQEAESRSVLLLDLYLQEHLVDVTGYRHQLLAKSDQDTRELLQKIGSCQQGPIRDVLLNSAAASNTMRIFPGLLGFETAW